GLPADNFSVRWSKTEYLAQGRYKFTTVTDDGVRLFVDGAAVIDQWYDHSATVHDAVVDLAGGNHTLRMEYYEAGVDAIAKLSWDTTTDAPSAHDAWTAQYWNTPGAGAAPAVPTRAADVTRQESAISYSWGLGSPAPGINADHFVARWSGVVTVDAG